MTVVCTSQRRASIEPGWSTSAPCETIRPFTTRPPVVVMCVSAPSRAGSFHRCQGMSEDASHRVPYLMTSDNGPFYVAGGKILPCPGNALRGDGDELDARMLDDELVPGRHVLENRRRHLDQDGIPSPRHRELHASRAPRRLRHDLQREQRLAVQPLTHRRVDLRATREAPLLPPLLPGAEHERTDHQHRHECCENPQTHHRRPPCFLRWGRFREGFPYFYFGDASPPSEPSARTTSTPPALTVTKSPAFRSLTSIVCTSYPGDASDVHVPVGRTRDRKSV